MNKAAAVLFVTLLAAGCASKPTLGDRMLSQGEAARSLGEKWNEGTAALAKGEALRKKGLQQIEDGKENVQEGDRLILKGRRQVEESEEEYDDRFGSSPR